MRVSARLPWLTLAHGKRRLAAAVAGITGAVLLMFVQIGFLNGLLDSSVELIAKLSADLVIVNRLKYTLTMNLPFPRRRLAQAQAVDGVIAARPVYMEREAAWKNPQTGRTRSIRVLGIPEAAVFRDPEIRAAASALGEFDTALMDTRSRPEYGVACPGTRTELALRSVRIVGLFTLGRDFMNDGTLIVSDRAFVRFFPHLVSEAGILETVEIGLLDLAPGADRLAVRQALREALPSDVAVLTREELSAQEIRYWEEAVPAGYVFGLGAALGFVVGVLMCYQILYTDVTDHLPQFATLKAMGYTNRYLLAVVLGQALVLSLLGFVPGVAIAAAVYHWLDGVIGFPMRLTIARAALVLLLTVTMATVAGGLAVRRAMTSDPAEVFG
jgi:putative ABC transport system permease protein